MNVTGSPDKCDLQFARPPGIPAALLPSSAVPVSPVSDCGAMAPLTARIQMLLRTSVTAMAAMLPHIRERPLGSRRSVMVAMLPTAGWAR